MLPRLEELLDGYEYLKRRHQWRWPIDPVGVAVALREAAALAGGCVEDEPAALLFALTRRRIDLADAWERLPLLLVRSLARRSLGAELRLDVDDPAVRALRMRILARDPEGRATFDDVRAFIAARLRPLE
jgi:hypothetical protein